MGLPTASARPTSVIKSLPVKVASARSHFTPRISSISTRVIGCLYATMDKVSKAACESDEREGV
ncbi:hypothetical protein D3C85_1598900 [compost metagenome]